MEAIYWLVLFIILLVIEVVTLGLTTIWFAGGALAAFIAALLHAHLAVQIILFLLVSIVLLVFTRPFAIRFVNKDRAKTNVEGVIGQSGVVTETINNLMGQGTVVLAGQEWTARAASDHQIIEKDKIVVIQKVKGVKLIVEEKKEEV